MNGKWVDTKEQVESTFMEYYEGLLGNALINRKKVSNSVLNEGVTLN